MDTSAVDYQDVCPWKWQTQRGAQIILKRVYGTPLGTGDATVSVYIDEVLADRYVVSTNSPGGAIPDIGHDLGKDGFRVKSGKQSNKGHVLIRADRTTATTGGVGINYSIQN
jgi:hypothetical protein